MKALIVYANPNPESLSGRVKDVVKETLINKGHEVNVRDLYDLGFNPVLTAADQAANMNGALPKDITTEQEFINQADIIYFVYPIWWTGAPAIMKGYFDRVLLYGYAYKYGPTGIEKLMNGKPVVILNNHGNPKSVYETGMYDALKLTSDIGVMDFCGFDLKAHLFFPSAKSAAEEEKQSYLEKVKSLCESLI